MLVSKERDSKYSARRGKCEGCVDRGEMELGRCCLQQNHLVVYSGVCDFVQNLCAVIKLQESEFYVLETHLKEVGS